MKALFVTGTDTGVGKTMVSRAQATACAARDLRVSVMKPCETGNGDDADQLIAATGRPLPIEQVRPYFFPMAASPEEAAAAAGAAISVDRIVASYRLLRNSADVTLVEGAGGLLVPVAPGVLTVDLVVRLELPLLIVARPSLGTVNHTLLTIEAARRRGLRVLGVVFSRQHAVAGADEPTNPEAIARHGQVELLGTLPIISDPAALAEIAERHLRIDRLLSLI